MLRLNADLTKLVSSFTTYNYFNLDQGDVDVGSGGMMLLPNQPGSYPHLAVAGGKDGRSFLLNRDNLGGYTSGGPDDVLQTIDEGGCWCGPANYSDSAATTHVLTGGGNGVTSWKLETSPSTELVEESSTGSGPADGLPDYGGTIPVVSSNGTTANTAVVWFVQRPATSSDQDPARRLHCGHLRHRIFHSRCFPRKRAHGNTLTTATPILSQQWPMAMSMWPATSSWRFSDCLAISLPLTARPCIGRPRPPHRTLSSVRLPGTWLRRSMISTERSARSPAPNCIWRWPMAAASRWISAA